MIEIELVKHRERRDELLELFQVAFGHGILAELWNWKYLQNPFASADPEVIVALDNKKIVGARPFLVGEIWIGDEKKRTAQPCDTMVHPEYRRQGIFSRMNQFAIKYFIVDGCALFYNFPNPMSRPGYLKQGWKIVSEVETLFRPINPEKLISYKLRKQFLGSIGGFFYEKVLNAKAKLSPTPGPFQVKVFDQFSDELKEVDELRDKTAIDLVRSEAYLKWRFHHHPQHKYKYIVCKRGDELQGYAVVSVQELSGGLICGMIVDYLVKDKDIDCFRVLISKCLDELAKSDCDVISIWAFTQPVFRDELIKYFRFKSSLGFPYNRLLGKGYFVARELDKQILKKVDIYNKWNWRVTYAYPDTT